MWRSLMSAGLMVGLVVGFITGVAYTAARYAWVNYKSTKASVPRLRRAAWGLTGVAGSRIGLVVLLVVAGVVFAAIGGD